MVQQRRASGLLVALTCLLAGCAPARGLANVPKPAGTRAYAPGSAAASATATNAQRKRGTWKPAAAAAAAAAPGAAKPRAGVSRRQYLDTAAKALAAAGGAAAVAAVVAVPGGVAAAAPVAVQEEATGAARSSTGQALLPQQQEQRAAFEVQTAERPAPISTVQLADAAVGAVSAPPVDLQKILQKSFKRALGGGASGAAAAGVQVLSLMWLRTTMNYQYRNGGTTLEALQKLYGEGGIPRLYQGLPFALVQGPLSRFGDTAANAGVIALLDALPATSALPLPLKSAGGSVAAGLWRIALTPIDTVKTTLQVVGEGGTQALLQKLQVDGPSALFQGALATAAATMVGHYPWYLTYNALGEWLPQAPPGDELVRLLRAAFMGVCASSVSDCCSNSIRVVKTQKQTAPEQITYAEALRQILEADGVPGLFGRGLQTRLVTNGLQGALFSVLWKFFEAKFASAPAAAAAAAAVALTQ